MHEATWVAVALLGVLLLVVIVAMMRYITLARWQRAIQYAWFEAGWCPSSAANTDDACGIQARTDLGAPVLRTTDFDPALARVLLDYVARIELRSFKNASDEDLVCPPNHTELERYTPSQYSAPPFAVAWRIDGTEAIALSLRCTAAHEEIQEDLRGTQVDWVTGDVCHIEKSVCPSPELVHGARAQVHQGFYKIYQNYKAAWWDLITREQPTTVYIAGHSLGGCVGTLFAVDLAERAPPWLQQVVLYAFGAPRVGNAEFNDRLLHTSRLVAWRVVNDTDLIQNMPPHVQPNLEKPEMRPFYYEHAGPEYRFKLNWGTWKHNHFLPVYLAHFDEGQREP